MPAWLPLKSKRLASSFWAALTAFSISIEFTCETMSKLDMESSLIERGCDRKPRERARRTAKKKRQSPKPKYAARRPGAGADWGAVIAPSIEAGHFPFLTLC